MYRSHRSSPSFSFNSLEDLAATSGSTPRWTPVLQMFIIPSVHFSFLQYSAFINSFFLGSCFCFLACSLGTMAAIAGFLKRIPWLRLYLGQTFSVSFLNFTARSFHWYSGIAVHHHWSHYDWSPALQMFIIPFVRALSLTVVWIHWQLHSRRSLWLLGVPLGTIGGGRRVPQKNPVTAPVFGPNLPSWFLALRYIIFSLTVYHHGPYLRVCHACGLGFLKATRSRQALVLPPPWINPQWFQGSPMNPVAAPVFRPNPFR